MERSDKAFAKSIVLSQTSKLLHSLLRIVNIKNVMLAVQKGEDTRKLMRRMSRRQSNVAALS